MTVAGTTMIKTTGEVLPSHRPEISVVVPIYNEAESVPLLAEQLHATLSGPCRAGRPVTYEVIFVDDGSTDGTRRALQNVVARFPHFQAIFFRRNFGKSAAYSAAFHAARGEVIITIDGDLQDDPAEIPRLLAKLDEGYDLVSSWKKSRQDTLERRTSSRIFNFVVQHTTGVALHDFNCGFKAYRDWCVKSLTLSGNLYRFLPALVADHGGRIAEVPVTHHPRRFGTSKYGPRRYLHGLLDLCTIVLLTKFFSNPLYFFALVGLPLVVLGVVIGIVLVLGHIVWLVTGDISYALGPRPLFIVALGLIGFGLNMFLVGTLAEFVLHLRGGDVRQERYAIEGVVAHDDAARDG